MKLLTKLFAVITLSSTLSTSFFAFSNHVVIDQGNADDTDSHIDAYGYLQPEAPRPWYHDYNHNHYNDFRGDLFEVDNDPTDRLEDDTAWPSQREDFSDYLFR